MKEITYAFFRVLVHVLQRYQHFIKRFFTITYHCLLQVRRTMECSLRPQTSAYFAFTFCRRCHNNTPKLIFCAVPFAHFVLVLVNVFAFFAYYHTLKQHQAMVPSAPSPLPSDETEARQTSQGFTSYDSRIPKSGDEAYREILESCRHFYAFETPSTPFSQMKLLPRLEDSIMMLEQKRNDTVSEVGRGNWAVFS